MYVNTRQVMYVLFLLWIDDVATSDNALSTSCDPSYIHTCFNSELHHTYIYANNHTYIPSVRFSGACRTYFTNEELKTINNGFLKWKRNTAFSGWWWCSTGLIVERSNNFMWYIKYVDRANRTLNKELAIA